MKTIQIPTHLSISLDYPLAEWGRRLGGFLLDWLVKFIYIFLLVWFIGSLSFEVPTLLYLLLFSPVFLYSFLMERFFKGQTLGKMVTKTRVISTTGAAASPFQLLTRWLFNMVDVWAIILLSTMNSSFSALMIFGPLVGGVVIMITQYNQRVGDLAASTYVVSSEESSVDLQNTVFKYANEKQSYEPTYPQIMKLSDRDITKIQRLLDKGDLSQNEEMLDKLADHVKKVLKIETDEHAIIFLRKLLADYNFFAKQDSGGV